MPHPFSNYTKDPAWDDEKKIDSREQGIILSYHESFGRDSIPEDKQYWTMCGAYFNETTKEKLHGELGQLTDVGLIKPEQFHGVDCEEVTIKDNLEAYPDINWHHGDFKEVMGQAAYENRFDPAIINYDGVMQPEFGAKYLKSIMKFVDHNVKGELMLVANFMVNNPHSKQRLEEAYIINEAKSIADEFEQSNDFKFVWSDPSWNVLNDGEHIKFYLYRTSETNMASYIFWRKAI